MRTNRRLHVILSAAVSGLLLTVAITTAQAARSQGLTTPNEQHLTAPANLDRSRAAQVLRGHYIVFGVGMCNDCHTPRDDNGALIESRLLMGAPAPVHPSQPVRDWPATAPRIAGTPPATDEEMIRLLTTGIWKDGQQLRPPMPQFRMTAKTRKRCWRFSSRCRSTSDDKAAG